MSERSCTDLGLCQSRRCADCPELAARLPFRQDDAARRAVRIAHIAAEEWVIEHGSCTGYPDEYEFGVDVLAEDWLLRDCIDHLCWHSLAVKHEVADRTLVQLGDFTIRVVGA